MMRQSKDRRVVRTKRMIRDAFTKLMEEKGFEGITVSDLTEKADINRGTFYLHYNDKYDLLEQSENEMIEKIEGLVGDGENLLLKEVAKYIQKHEPAPIVIRLFELLADNADFMRVILGPNGNTSFQIKLKEVVKRKMLRHVLNQVKKDNIIVPIEYIYSYVTSAHLGVIQYWLESGMKESPHEMATIISRTTFLGPVNVAGLKGTFNLG